MSVNGGSRETVLRSFGFLREGRDHGCAGKCENGGDEREGEQSRAKGRSGGMVCVYLQNMWMCTDGECARGWSQR